MNDRFYTAADLEVSFSKKFLEKKYKLKHRKSFMEWAKESLIVKILLAVAAFVIIDHLWVMTDDGFHIWEQEASEKWHKERAAELNAERQKVRDSLYGDGYIIIQR